MITNKGALGLPWMGGLVAGLQLESPACLPLLVTSQFVMTRRTAAEDAIALIEYFRLPKTVRLFSKGWGGNVFQYTLGTHGGEARKDPSVQDGAGQRRKVLISANLQD